ncbi:MAG: hypothetical protein AB7S80_05760 [Rhizobiaceae bacterium]
MPGKVLGDTMYWLRSVAFWLLLCSPVIGVLPAQADPIGAVAVPPAAIKVRVFLVGEETLCPGETNFVGCLIRRSDCNGMLERDCIEMFIQTELMDNERIEFELRNVITRIDKSTPESSSFFAAVADFNQHIVDNNFLAAVFVFDFPPPQPISMHYQREHPEFPRTIEKTIETDRYIYWMNSLFIHDERTRLRFTFNGQLKVIIFS